MRDRLSSSNDRLSKIDDEIEEHIPEDELGVEYATAAEYNDEAISMLAELTCRIEALERAERDRATPSQAPPVQPNVTDNAVLPRSFCRPSLPKLDMPTFKGDINQWTGFWEQFEQTVHLNNALSSPTKFFY